MNGHSEQNRHYNRAPIIEAIMDFTTEPMLNERLPDLDEVGRALSETYPEAVPESEARIEAPDRALRSHDGLQVVRIRRDGFSFSRLAPYDRWESFTAEARRTWSIYQSQIQPTALTRFLVRYINRFELPFGIPLHRFFNVYPAMPDRDALLSNLFMFVETTVDEPPGVCAVLMAPAGRDSETMRFRMLLDNTFSFQIRTDEAVWRNLDQIRRLKNSTFGAQLTDELKETIS